jgi:hypothetical protein
MVQPDNRGECFVTPLNQPSKPEYLRDVIPGDVCFPIEDFAKILKNARRAETCAE